MKQSVPTVHVVARVPVDLAATFERVAEGEDRTISQALRQAIRHYVAQTENGRPQKPTVLQNRAETEREYERF